MRSLRIVHLSQKNNTFCSPEVNQLYQVVLQGVESLVCSVDLWRLLGNNKKPENQEVSDNKEEAKQGKRSEWSDFTDAGADQLDCCNMLSISHFR
jgi:hypothetical protein